MRPAHFLRRSLLSVILLQLSSGGCGAMDVLSGSSWLYQPQDRPVGVGGIFVGFFLGCWGAPRLFWASVGHSRAFAAFTATGAIGRLSHMMVLTPIAWAPMRVASGFLALQGVTPVRSRHGCRPKLPTRRAAYHGGVPRCRHQRVVGRTDDHPRARTCIHYVSYNLLANLVLRRADPAGADPPCPSPKPLKGTVAPQALATSAVPLGRFGLRWSSQHCRAHPSGWLRRDYGQEVGLPPVRSRVFLSAFVLGGRDGAISSLAG